MRYSTEPKHRKYDKRLFEKIDLLLPFARKFGDKYGKKLMHAATKTGIEAAKTSSKRVVQKTAEATGRDLIGNKIADKITSLGKIKSKKKRRKARNLHTTRRKTSNS